MLLRLATVGLLAAVLVKLPATQTIVVVQQTQWAPAQVNSSLADRIVANPDLLAGDLLLPLGLEARDSIHGITRLDDRLVFDILRRGETLHIIVPISES